jgi:hypothetical protein
MPAAPRYEENPPRPGRPGALVPGGAPGPGTVAGRPSSPVVASPLVASPVVASPDADPGRPGSPWRVRAAAGPAGRPAIEIHAAGRLVDVLVAPALAARVLRGPAP